MSAERPDPCAECERLREQARAAYLSGDYSRETDVRVLTARHVRAAHPAQSQQRQGAA